MFSKILIKLIDQAIVPAILLLVTRIVTMIVFSRFMNVTYQITNSGFLFDNQADYVQVNSYSVLSMIIVLAFGVFYILLKSIVFHDSHVTPQMTTKLFTLRLSSFIQTSYDLYSQGAVWLAQRALSLIPIPSTREGGAGPARGVGSAEPGREAQAQINDRDPSNLSGRRRVQNPAYRFAVFLFLRARQWALFFRQTCIFAKKLCSGPQASCSFWALCCSFPSTP